MTQIRFSVLRGVCQMPAYSAADEGFFEAEGLDVRLNVEPTAWMVPRRMADGETLFAVMPWTRVAAEPDENRTLVLLAGSGLEEAAIVVPSPASLIETAMSGSAVPVRRHSLPRSKAPRFESAACNRRPV